MPMVTRTPGTSGSLAPLTSGLRVIPVDVLEDDKSYILRADLPGMKKEDVNVEVDGQIVRISATKKDTKKWEDEGYKYHRYETLIATSLAFRTLTRVTFITLQSGTSRHDGVLSETTAHAG